MNEKRDAYIEKMKAKLDKWNGDINTIEERARQVGADSKAELRNQIENVKTKRADVEKKIENLGQAGDAAWKDLKAGVKTSWKALDKAVRSASGNFRHAKPPKEA